MKLSVFVIASCLVLQTFAFPSELTNIVDEATLKKVENHPLVKDFTKCARDDGIAGVMTCASERALKSLETMAKKPELEILPGVTLTSDNPNVQRNAKKLSDDEPLSENPRERALQLLDLLLENIANVFSGRTLKVKMPEDISESLERKFGDSLMKPLLKGKKGKKGKKGLLTKLILGGAGKLIALIPVALGGLAIFVTKAFVIAKVALVLSGILFFQSFLSGSGSGGSGGSGGSNIFSKLFGQSQSSPQVVYSTGYGGGWSNSGSGYNSYTPSSSYGGPYKRSTVESAQDMAYAKSK